MADLTVAQVLDMPALRGAGALVRAGGDGLSRPVRWVHSAELADIAPLLRSGDLLLSTGIALPGEDEDLAAFADSLGAAGVAGLLIELGRRWDTLPGALVAACDRLGLPLVALTREVRFAAVAQAVGERIVDEQLAQLREAERVHETFTELSLAEAEPATILEAVERLAGAAVVLENQEHRVLDYRTGPHDMTAFLSDWTGRSRAVRLQGRTSWDDANGWLLTRIGRRERGWGRLVVEAPHPPTQRLVIIAERAAAALVTHRLYDRHRDSLVRRTHHELLLGLLADPSDPEVHRRCQLAGVPLERRQLVGLTLRTSLATSADRTAADVVEDVIASLVHLTHEARIPALVCEVDREVRALLSFPLRSHPERATDELATRLRRRHSVLVCAGRVVQRMSEIDRTLHESRHVADSVADGGVGRVVHRLEDVRLRGLLTLLRDDERLTLFAKAELENIKAHDQDRGSNLLQVLRSFLQHPASKSHAAASLHLSRPAFYDRLAKIEQLLDCDLDDPDVRVSLHVALLADEVASGQRV